MRAPWGGGESVLIADTVEYEALTAAINLSCSVHAALGAVDPTVIQLYN